MSGFKNSTIFLLVILAFCLCSIEWCSADFQESEMTFKSGVLQRRNRSFFQVTSTMKEEARKRQKEIEKALKILLGKTKSRNYRA